MNDTQIHNLKENCKTTALIGVLMLSVALGESKFIESNPSNTYVPVLKAVETLISYLGWGTFGLGSLGLLFALAIEHAGGDFDQQACREEIEEESMN